VNKRQHAALRVLEGAARTSRRIVPVAGYLDIEERVEASISLDGDRLRVMLWLPCPGNDPHGWLKASYFETDRLEEARAAYVRLCEYVTRLGIISPRDYRFSLGWEYW
jgi:hypothetical protein